MVKKVELYMEKHGMVREGDRIIAGVSGGADSVCLFLILQEYCKKKGAELIVVHMNHGIRKEASADEKYVEKMCKEAGVTCHIFREDIPAYAKEKGIGTEEAGRMARYAAFEKIREPFGDRGKIAVAHNRNDQAETTLFHMLRGSGVSGLAGILPVRERIIRPLLCVERKEIEEYLSGKGVEWCIDLTNEENTYTRNKLRNVVFPYFEKEICKQSIRHVANVAEEMAGIRSFLEELTDRAEESVFLIKKDRIDIDRDKFMQQHEVIRKQLLLRAFSYLIPARKDFTAVHVKDLLALFEKNSGKQIPLPYGLYAAREFDKIVIRHKETKKSERAAIAVTIPGRMVSENGEEIEFSLLTDKIYPKIPQKTYTKWFDYDKIQSCLVLRNRQPGDYLVINDDGGRKTIKQYFIEEKIPCANRGNKLLLADEKHILWVIGMRISEAYKVTDQTKTILQVKIKQTNEERS